MFKEVTVFKEMGAEGHYPPELSKPPFLEIGLFSSPFSGGPDSPEKSKKPPGKRPFPSETLESA